MAQTGGDRAAAFKKLHRFAERPEFRRELRASWEVFWGKTLDVTKPEERNDLLSTEMVHVNLSAYHHLDREIRTGRTFLDLLLEAKDVHLSSGERTFLEALSETYIQIYEIQEITRGEGARLKNLWREEEPIWVHEKLGTRHLSQWDLLAARVIKYPSGRHEFEGDMYPFPARAKDVVLENLRRHHERLRGTQRRLPDREFFKQAAPLFNQVWMLNVAFAPPPRVVTAEGDPLVIATVAFDVIDPSAIAEAMDKSPDFRREEEELWTWNEEAENDTLRILGRFELKGRSLVLETTSRQRADRGRKLIEDLAGRAVHFLRAEFEVPDLLKERVGTMTRNNPAVRSAEREDPHLPDVTRLSIEARLMDEAHHRWLDEPVPLLGNRTPRHAARLKTVRPKLVDLLKQFENAEEHKALGGQAPYDFGWMWRELGLDSLRNG